MMSLDRFKRLMYNKCHRKWIIFPSTVYVKWKYTRLSNKNIHLRGPKTSQPSRGKTDGGLTFGTEELFKASLTKTLF